jgi:hypothetical protein
LNDYQQQVDSKFIDSQKLIKITAFQKDKCSEYKWKLTEIEKELEIEDKKFQHAAMEENNIKNKLTAEFDNIKKINVTLTNELDSLSKNKKTLLEKDAIFEEHVQTRNQIDETNIVSREKYRKSMRLQQISSPEKIQKRIFSNMNQPSLDFDESENISPLQLNRGNRFTTQSNINIGKHQQLNEIDDGSYNSISEDEYSHQPKKKQFSQPQSLSQPFITLDESPPLSPVVARMRSSAPVAKLRQTKPLANLKPKSVNMRRK